MTTHQKQIKELFDKSRQIMKTYLREKFPSIRVIDIYQNDPNVPWRTYSGFGYGPEWEWKGGYVELIVECSVRREVAISICEDCFWNDDRFKIKKGRHKLYFRFWRDGDSPVLVYFD